MRLLSGPTGEIASDKTLFSDENLGVSPWNIAAGAAVASGWLNNTAAGLSVIESGTPDLALKPPTIEDPFMQAPSIEQMQTFRPTSPEETQKDWRVLSRTEAKIRGQTLVTDHEQFKKDYPTVPDEPGMTYERAAAIKQTQDQQAVRDFYQKGRPITSFIGGMIGNIPTPENFIPFAGPVNYAARSTRLARAIYGAGKGAAEAVIGTTLFDLSTMHQRAGLGQDTSWRAFAQDIAFSALIGSGFGYVGGALATSPSPRANPAQKMLSTPENEAKANVVMNDAVGSFLNSPDNAVELSPSSYRFLQELKIPDSNVHINYDSLRTDDAGNVQSFTESVLLQFPEIRRIMEGTQVATEGGTPKVVYAGLIGDPSGRLDLQAGKEGIFFSDNPDYSISPEQVHTGVYTFHGTARDYPEYDLSHAGSHTKQVDTGKSIFSVNEPSTAGDYGPIMNFFGPDRKYGYKVYADPEAYPELKQRMEKADYEKYKKLAEEYRKIDEQGRAAYDKYGDLSIEVIDATNALDNKMREIQALIGLYSTPGVNIRPSRVLFNNPLVVADGRAYDRMDKRAALIEQAIKDGHDGIILKNTRDLGIAGIDRAGENTYIALKPDTIKSALDAQAQGNAIKPALLDMKNPYTFDAQGRYISPAERNRLIRKAKASGFDGIILKNTLVGTKTETQYGTWNPDNILGLADVSAKMLNDLRDQRAGLFENASNASKNPGYSYNEYRPYNDPNYKGDLTTNNVDMTTLSKMADLYKFRQESSKAIGGDLETGKSPLDEEFKAKFKDQEPPAAAKAELEEADLEMKKADQAEEIMKFALGCKDG